MLHFIQQEGQTHFNIYRDHLLVWRIKQGNYYHRYRELSMSYIEQATAVHVTEGAIVITTDEVGIGEVYFIVIPCELL